MSENRPCCAIAQQPWFEDRPLADLLITSSPHNPTAAKPYTSPNPRGFPHRHIHPIPRPRPPRMFHPLASPRTAPRRIVSRFPQSKLLSICQTPPSTSQPHLSLQLPPQLSPTEPTSFTQTTMNDPCFPIVVHSPLDPASTAGVSTAQTHGHPHRLNELDHIIPPRHDLRRRPVPLCF